MTRRSTLRFFAIISLAATLGYAQSRGNSDSGTSPKETPVADRQSAIANELKGAGEHGFRLREGMKIVDQVGELKEQSGRVVFIPEGSTYEFRVLENLALERVSDELRHSHRLWTITGTVTEYNRANYLLLHRAVRKAQVSGAPGPRS